MPESERSRKELSKTWLPRNNNLNPGRTPVTRTYRLTWFFGNSTLPETPYAAEHGNDSDRIFADLMRRETTSDVALFRED